MCTVGASLSRPKFRIVPFQGVSRRVVRLKIGDRNESEIRRRIRIIRNYSASERSVNRRREVRRRIRRRRIRRRVTRRKRRN